VPPLLPFPVNYCVNSLHTDESSCCSGWNHIFTELSSASFLSLTNTVPPLPERNGSEHFYHKALGGQSAWGGGGGGGFFFQGGGGVVGGGWGGIGWLHRGSQ